MKQLFFTYIILISNCKIDQITVKIKKKNCINFYVSAIMYFLHSNLKISDINYYFYTHR